MANFAASWSAHSAHFADGERGEEVLEIEALSSFAMEVFKSLARCFSAECTDGDRLGFSASEERASVRAGQDRLVRSSMGRISLRPRPSIRFFSFKDHFAHESRLEIFVREQDVGFRMLVFCSFWKKCFQTLSL